MRPIRPLTLGLALLAQPASADVDLGMITDGEAWRAEASNGRKMNLTLRPDGSATIRRGIIFLSIGWQAKGAQLCLTDVPWSDAPQCMSASVIEAGYLLTDDEGNTIALTR